ncbi:hypothetical protein TTHERM_000837801 (macronuclear) [Tetrahymena thermophila SB210]|uniref:Uncharacterized protein n=1 Tax=Tetrahymena thermophila (strain SB210) TaxID=312017 RepID=W7X5M0_TETTS|nr:hypothetical protein TTHERM_000837801 [Tetrahymena thermophila SB210]EWS71653.1 hypothetical protein TTHERM_000837801 [Tetrahymena thermophila SB210]|eukprot:XP_012655813.1 hypothetical protein TTHERM_000837801 [Tetrahymena thermophila SB210]
MNLILYLQSKQVISYQSQTSDILLTRQQDRSKFKINEFVNSLKMYFKYQITSPKNQQQIINQKIEKLKKEKKIDKMQFKNAILILLVFVLLICSNPSSQVEAKALKSQTQSTKEQSIHGCSKQGESCKSQRCCSGGNCFAGLCFPN